MRAIQKHGAESVELALFGASFEPKTEKYNPQDYVKISRILRPDAKGEERIDRFVNLGSQARAKQENQKKATARLIEMRTAAQGVAPDEWAEQDPDKVREIIRGITKEMPR